jgi:hypothetical protein
MKKTILGVPYFQSKQTNGLQVLNETGFSKRILTPLLNAVGQVARDLALTDVRVILETELDSLKSGYCGLTTTKKPYVVIDPESAMYDDDWLTWIDPEEIRKVVAHELRHAWQYFTGMMQDAENGVLWNGQFFQWYDTSEMKWLLDDAELKQYDDQPWERDARQYAGEFEEEGQA